jgi:hypothetical protein
MASTPKYTTYVGGKATDAHKLLAKLFPASAEYPTMKALQDALQSGDELKAYAVIVKNATAVVDAQGVGGLIPVDGVQKGDPGMFPTAVKFGFGDAPDVSKVKWANPGDPANPYFPDITSPGPGKTDGKDKSVDPKLAIDDVPHTTIDTAGDDVRNPAADSKKVYDNTGIGKDFTLGKSGA